jgi:molybdenum cofactor cytidylyltransferase
MLRTTTELYQAAFPAVRLVIAPRDSAIDGTLLDELGIRLRPTDDMVIVPDADLGMGHSLAAGATHLDTRFLFVALADMPFVRLDTLVSLRDRSQTLPEDAILVPCFEGKRGHPVGFGRSWHDAMTRLRGDEGARPLLREGSPVMMETDDPGVLQDLDQLPDP